MRNLRAQLLISHLALAGLMVVVMVGAVVNFFRLGRSIDRILTANYKSVIAAQNMKETLERQDSAGQFYLAGQVGLARAQYEANRALFQSAFGFETHNVTEPGEQRLVDEVDRLYADYRQQLERLLYADPPMSPADARAFNFGVLEPQFTRIKQRAQDILELNQTAIVRADERARAEARRASYTSVGVTAGALLFALFLVPWTVRATLLPIRTLARQAEEIGVGHLNQRIGIHRTDEIGTLATAFNQMTERLREARRLEDERFHRAERMSDAALESLYDPVIVTDGEGQVVHLNPAAEGLFGPSDQARGRAISLVAGETRIAEAVEHAIHELRPLALEDEAGFVTRSEGEGRRTYRLRASPMREEDGNLLGTVTVLEDITHLRELDRLKSEFIGVASHELRTPVTSLQLGTELLLEGAVGPLTDGQREVVQSQQEDLNRLQRTMQDLLDITRLEAGVTPPRFEIVDAAELVEPALSALGAQADTKSITLAHDIEPDLPPVRADRSQIGRVLVNLVNNAIRHTPRWGSVTISVSRASGGVEFQVKDNGTGIAEEYLPHIFERFVQVPGATGGGAGLGLSIAQTIVKAHGSEIHVTSQPGVGTEFHFTLPGG